MNFNKYHVSRNLLDESMIQQGYYGGLSSTYKDFSADDRYRSFTKNLKAGTYTLNITADETMYILRCSNDVDGLIVVSSNPPYTFTLSADTTIYVSWRNTNTTNSFTNMTVMLNTGSQPLPYEPYSSEVWHDTPHYIMGTSTDTITTLPAVVYANDTTATVGLKGQMVQSSTPTPTTPIQPNECGDLETTGEHAGQYKIPILNNSQTTNVYLGEVESTRKIRKLVLDGTENGWTKSSTYQGSFYNPILENVNTNTYTLLCSHAVFTLAIDAEHYTYGKCAIDGGSATRNLNLFLGEASWTVDDFKDYLQQQYAAGTPVCVWYVLAEPTTGIVNEPLRKIGDYADSVSGITIPTIAGANTIDVDTTLKPSEVSVNYHGWHPVAGVHERESGQWD